MSVDPPADGGELRFDPLTGEWVSIVGHRQSRPNLPDDGCPFCPGGLEAPELGGAAVWGRVQPALAARTRVCAYDRSGLGWSEASGLRVDVTRAADELHALLGLPGLVLLHDVEDQALPDAHLPAPVLRHRRVLGHRA